MPYLCDVNHDKRVLTMSFWVAGWPKKNEDSNL